MLLALAVPAAIAVPAVVANALGIAAPSGSAGWLGIADLRSPLFWAVMIGWIMSVVLHEFAHGVVAYWGGDYTIRERGGLSLNPLQYVDPVMSLVLPVVFLLIGGIALPGGVTYVRRDLLRSRYWDSGVSLAGPAMNVLLFLAGAVALHPKTGWLDPATLPTDWTPAQLVVAALTTLQMFAAIINLIPCPPLDGFGVIGPFLNPETREKMTTPPTSTGLFVVLFVVLVSGPVQVQIGRIITGALQLVGFDYTEAVHINRAYQLAVYSPR